MFKPETNQGFENVNEKQVNAPASEFLENNLRYDGAATKLLTGTIQSPNYERGVRGWCLFADGNIDFPGI